jgi:ketosteroid isomerase-like protein
MELPLNFPAIVVEPPNRIWLRPARALSVVARAVALDVPASGTTATAATTSKARRVGTVSVPLGFAMGRRYSVRTAMSRENVEVVLDQFAATNERDFPRAMSHYAEDVELVVDPVAFLEGGTFKGRHAVGQWFGNWFATFEPGYHFDIEETRDLCDVVLLIASHRGRGRASGAEVHGQTGYLYGLRDGKIVRVEIYPNRAETLEAAGLPE